MKTATQIIDGLGIQPRHYNEGKQTCLCPQCSHTRKKKRSKCLSVKIDEKGVQWYCFHCNWSGGEFYEGGKEWMPPKKKRKTLTMADLRGIRRNA